MDIRIMTHEGGLPDVELTVEAAMELAQTLIGLALEVQQQKKLGWKRCHAGKKIVGLSMDLKSVASIHFSVEATQP
ncbi:hypothetical protein CPT_Summit_039 [Stenotrophomonas phage Summit]|nr:hypothetical protein CPT_Summit_039 [Stenotrophomonas phage Summit]